MSKIRTIGHAAILAAGFLAAPLFVAACPANVAKPFNSGPFDPAGPQQGLFSEWIVDTNGVGLQICTDSLGAGAGVAPPCIVTPVIPGNTLSAQLNRGVEAFYYLANSVFTTTGAFPVDAVLVMGIESAFLSPEPIVGFQTQFSRLRTRINVNAVGIYTVEHPWGKDIYRVDTLLAPGNGQNRAEISSPVNFTFTASSTNPGLVTPFLIATSKPALTGLVDPVTGQAINPANYIGDGLTLTTVTGSPCGDNFIRITATKLDGVTPIDINNGSNVYTNAQFTIMGKLAPTAAVPLAIGAAYYDRSAGATTVTVLAEGSTSATEAATMTVSINNVDVPMARDATRFYGRVPVTGTLPATVTVTAVDNGKPSLPNPQTATLKDQVTVDTAEARCTGTGATRSCLLSVTASSSDDGSAGPVTLVLAHTNTPLVNGSAAVVSTAVPASITVTSSQGGAAIKPVTVINQ
jgi:hypothetical protein